VSTISPDVATEISTRVVSVFFRRFEKLYGKESLAAAVARIGGEPTLEYLLDPENFVSLAYLERVARVLTEDSGDPDFLRRAGEHQLDDPGMLGFVYYLARSLGSPKLYYRMAVKTAPSFNRVGDMTIEAETDVSARLRYRSRKPEASRLICEGRIGQLASAPTIWGLPPAEVRELECQLVGAPACLYEIHWLPRERTGLRAMGGGAIGLAVGTLVGGLAGALAGAAIGGLAMLADSYRRESRRNLAQIMDGLEASSRSMRELQRRFEEVQRLHAEASRSQVALIEAQKLDAVGRLSGGIAHDFNNILTVIKGCADFARQRVGGPESAEEVRGELDDIKAAADRAGDLTRRLLAFARRQIIEPRVIELATHLRQLVPLLTRLVGEDIYLTLELAPEPLNVNVDATQLEQLVLNLAANARDAMPLGGVVRIATRAQTVGTKGDGAGAAPTSGPQPGEYVSLAVSDEGHGMDEETRSRVFEPFFTTKEPGKGTGLGLATCHGIAHQAGGTIAVDSAPGRGSTFRVLLPRVDDVAAIMPIARRASGTFAGNETILVVEDDARVRRIIARTLAERGYRVLEASNADEALSVARTETARIHLLLSDVVMPGLDGRSLAERLCAGRPGLRVLFVSGYSNEVISSRGVLAEGITLVRKPFAADELLAGVRGVLDEQHDALATVG